MKIKGIITEDFVNYKLPSMTVMFPRCTLKCGKELCQNHPLLNEPDIDIKITNIIDMYIKNPISEALVLQGMEPFDSWEDLYDLVLNFRIYSNDPIVIYTGYNESEIKQEVLALQLHRNIIIKFGRYIPNQEKHYDKELGVYLASDNQYARKVS